MKFLNNKSFGIATLLITALLFLVLTVSINSSLNNIKTQIWDGFFILMVEKRAPVEEISSELEKYVDFKVIDAYNSMITLFDYTGDRTIPVADLADYYVEEDPLYDPFLRKLPSLFSGETDGDEYSIIYVASDLSPSLFLRQISSIMSGFNYKWYLPDIKTGKSLLNIVVFILFSGILIYWNKNRLILLLPGLLPWFIYSAGSDFTGMIVSVIFLYAWSLTGSLLYRSYRHFLNFGKFESLDMKKLAASLLLMLLSFIYRMVIGDHTGEVAPYFMALAAHFSSIIFYVIILVYKRRRQQHRIFFPVKIKNGFSFRFGFEFAVSCAFVLVILVTPLIPGNRSPYADFKIPVPVKIEGLSDFSQRSLQVLNSHSGQSEIPDLSDYISHMSYLEIYPYGFKYKFPEQDEILTVPRFKVNNGELIEENVAVNIFTDKWYESIISDGLNSGIVTLLLSQNSPTLVKYQSESRGMVRDDYLRKHYWFSLFLILALSLWFINISPSDWFGLKEYVVRRKQQVV